MRPFTKDKEEKKTTPAPFHLAKAHKRLKKSLRNRNPVISNAEVKDYMLAHGIKTATLRQRRKIASHLRKIKYVQTLEV